ncbi:MAG: 6-bladed beta-propeller [Candidatus Latescibacterota bacterium]|jgi:hypothetical protein
MKLIHATAIIALCAVLPGPSLAEWQGQEVVEDGTRIVRNPETAPENLTLTPEEQWRRGEEDDDLFFGTPVQILEDDEGNVYVLDSQVSEIVVFTPGGEYLRTIGREGEGPGEFRGANDMFIRSDGIIGVVVVFPGKIIQLNRDGTPAGVFPFPKSNVEGFQLIYKGVAAGDRIVLSGGVQKSGGGGGVQSEQENYLKAFDYEGNEVAHYHSMSEMTQYGGMKFDEKIFANFKGQWAAAADGRAAAALSFDDYRIHVWKPDGSPDYIIERPDYAPLERDGQQLERFQKLYDGVTSWNPNSTFEVSKTHRAIVQLMFRPDGSLWVLSGRGVWAREDGVFATFDVYDDGGRFVRRITVKGPGDPMDDGLFFTKSRFYRVTDQFSAFMANFGGGDTAGAGGDGEPLQVVAYDIELPELGAR